MVSFTSQTTFVLLLVLSATTFNKSLCSKNKMVRCNEKDRWALSIFKQGVVDPYNLLFTWSNEEDCCAWRGIQCDNITGRVTKLDLSNYSESLRGDINLYLLELEFLNYLDLNSNDFERIIIPSIHDYAANHSHPHAYFSNLEHLDLSDNYRLQLDHLHWLSPLSSLKSLGLSGIDLHKEVNWLSSMASLSSLSELRLAGCELNNISPYVENVNFRSLEILDLSGNHFDSELPNWLLNLSNSLSGLDFHNNSLRGQIPDWSSYRNLHYLLLSNNKLNGSIPNWLGQLEHLKHLDISSNLFYGSIPSNLGNLSSSGTYLDISSNRLSGNLPKSFEQPFVVLDLSLNSISGDLSNMLLSSTNIFMAFNNFKGGLPQISAKVQYLVLGNNSFSGTLSPLLCNNVNKLNKRNGLMYLDISYNFLTGELPNCWKNWESLNYVYLGSNSLTGEVPPSMGSLISLKSLGLHDNSFSGDIPSSLQNCTELVLLNLEQNNFSGSIPNWMPQGVSVIKLRSNQFTGNIPPQLCQLSNLTILDLADNKLSGLIPQCLCKLTSMASGLPNDALINKKEPIPAGEEHVYMFKITLSPKGQRLKYLRNLKLVRIIDLSANKLSGEIPAQLFRLIKLQFFNLSFNHLTGKIPEQIGGMKDLESLDFSHNKLHGEIPQSLSSLSFVSVLNLSYNNFTGQIPSGTQLQGFDAWSYIGNPELCGSPLPKNCTKREEPHNPNLAGGNEDESFLKSLYLGMGVGFAVGFWGICGSLFLNRAWRHTYFRFYDRVVDRIYVFVALKFQRFH